jgi:hypothetical protein
MGYLAGARISETFKFDTLRATPNRAIDAVGGVPEGRLYTIGVDVQLPGDTSTAPDSIVDVTQTEPRKRYASVRDATDGADCRPSPTSRTRDHRHMPKCSGGLIQDIGTPSPADPKTFNPTRRQTDR